MATLNDVEFVVQTMAETAVSQEDYFCQLDAVVGDGDFGYSLARGFERVLQEWNDYDRSDPGVFLMKVAKTIMARVGGTSGPIWGTAFLRAGSTLKGREDLRGGDVVEALRASVDGIKARGQAELGEKTLLDALVPAIDTLEAELGRGTDAAGCLNAMAATARTSAEATASMQAHRGRASYTGERSIGSVDAGAMGVAVLIEKVAERWPHH